MLGALQRALEVAHYAARHRNGVVVAALGEGVLVEDILLDLKLVQAHGVPMVVVSTEADVQHPLVADVQAEGLPLAPTESGDPETIRAALSAGRLPLVGMSQPLAAAVSLARQLGVSRLLVVRPPQEAAPSTRPHLTIEEAGSVSGPPGWDTVLAALTDPSGIPAAVYVAGKPGAIFAELFTHQGAGVLIGDALVERVRPARITDAADLELLLRGEVERGVLRPVPLHDVARTAHQHLVYTIDGLVVATARLRPYGTWAELSRFATFPRYRGRGRARTLGEALMTRAETLGYTDVFGLSVDARMWRFFESLGMAPIERGSLPTAWQEAYDFCRPSRAYLRTFS